MIRNRIDPNSTLPATRESGGVRNRVDENAETPTRSVIDRINQFFYTLVEQIKVSKGNILLGKETGEGFAEEIEIGSGLDITDGVISAKSSTESLSGYLAEYDEDGNLTIGTSTTNSDLLLKHGSGLVYEYNSGDESGSISVGRAGLEDGDDFWQEHPRASGYIAITDNESGKFSAGEVSGLGNSATLDVGTIAGTVAAGNHTHNYLPATLHATLTIGIGDSAVTYEAVISGSDGELVSVSHQAPSISPVSASHIGNAILVSRGTGRIITGNLSNSSGSVAFPWLYLIDPIPEAHAEYVSQLWTDTQSGTSFNYFLASTIEGWILGKGSVFNNATSLWYSVSIESDPAMIPDDFDLSAWHGVINAIGVPKVSSTSDTASSIAAAVNRDVPELVLAVAGGTGSGQIVTQTQTFLHL